MTDIAVVYLVGVVYGVIVGLVIFGLLAVKRLFTSIIKS